MKTVVNKEVALEDLKRLVNKYVKRPDETEKLEEKYPDVLFAIMDGFLSIDENSIPTYKLKDAILTEKGDVYLSEIKFKTRILPSQMTSLAKGLHPINDLYLIQNKMLCEIIDVNVVILDKFSKYDYEALSQISSIFS
jgi:hypothetical protein